MKQLTQIISQDARDVIRRVDFSELDGKTIFITGASGIVGTHLLAALMNLRVAGIKIRIIAATHSPFPEYLSDIIAGVECIQGDLTDLSIRQKLPQADYIIHAAGYGQPGRFMEDPVKTIELNTTCTIDLLRALKPGGKMLFTSTSEVYSGLPTPPYSEEQIGVTNTTHPRSCYIEGKRCGEAIVNAYRELGIEAKSVRLSLAYGPGTKRNDARVINSFIHKGLTEKKISLMDGGEARRTYCYISDAVEIMWNVLLWGKEPIYNVGGISKTTIGELAKMIGSELGVPVLFPHGTAEGLAGAPNEVALDMSKVKNEFGKTAFISLEEGVRRTIAWQQALYL